MTSEAPSILQALASLLLVLGMIGALAYLYRRVAQGTAGIPLISRTNEPKRLAIVETLWLDARYRMVVVRDNNTERTLVLGPERALQLSQNSSGLTDEK